MNDNDLLPHLTERMERIETRRATWLFLGNVLTPGSALQDPAVLSNFLTGQKGLSSYSRSLLTKAAQSPIDTAIGLAAPSPMAAAILDLVDRRAILPQLGAVLVPETKAIGAVEVTDPNAVFMAEGSPMPMSGMAFTAASLDAKTIAGGVTATKELFKFGRPNLTLLFERRLTAAVAKTWNAALLDPTSGATAARPASLTNGLTPVTAGSDLQTTLGLVLGAISGGAPAAPVIVTSIGIASRLLALRDLAALGVKVLIAPEAGSRLIAIDGDGVMWVDGGGSVSLAQNASAQLDTAPADPGTSATVFVDFFSRNLVGVKVVRLVGWAKRADAVAYADIT